MSNFWYYTLALIAVIAVLIYKILTAKYNYWKDRNVVFVPPKILVGNLLDNLLNRKSPAELFKEFYDAHPNEKYVGLFRLRYPQLMIRDPELIRDVFIKNFARFQNRSEDIDDEALMKERIMVNLFTAPKDMWRVSRQKLSPTFTSGKLRSMFYLITEKGEDFEHCLDVEVRNGEVQEVRELMARFTTEVIGSCAFGLKLNSMLDTEDEFRKMGKMIFDLDMKKVPALVLRVLFPNLFYALGLKMFPRTLEDFFVKIVKDVMESRRNETVKRNDFIDLLIELKDQNADNDELVMDDVFMAAQTLIFFAAGFETSSTAMSTILFELAHHPEIQDRLVDEIDGVLKKSDGKLTYDNIKEMEYLEMVISEGMRKYPALGAIPRSCTMTHKLADSDLVIENGLSVVIPVLALHYDPKYFPEPEKFIPERFSPEARKKIHPMVYLPFGEGPRNCIGMRFGKIQVKVGIISLLKNYRVEPSEKTKRLRFKPLNFVLTPKDGVWLSLKRRTPK